MSETWTEYGWQVISTGAVEECGRGATQETALRVLIPGERIVGRTVTASDWLPVDTDGAK